MGEAKDYHNGKPHPLNIFGSRLVAFANDDGGISVLDAYCPHMGADLSQCEVVEGRIVCPFHYWEFGGSSRCAKIPYSDRVPPKAKTKNWLTKEVNKILFVWHNLEGSPPAEGVEIPYFPETDNDEWNDSWHVDLMYIETNLVDNLSDVIHFGPVHGAPCTYFANTFEGHIGTQEFHGDSGRLGGGLVAISAYYGPATHITRMSAEYEGGAIESILLNSHVPTGPNSFELRFDVLVKKNPELKDEQNNDLAKQYVEANRVAFYQNVEIWKYKALIDNPVLAEGDGPIYQLREWYSQFFMDENDFLQS